MVTVEYAGGLGNNLFQYCFGRIIANHFGYQLRAAPIDGFSGTTDVVDGVSHDGPVVAYRGADYPDIFALLSDRAPRHIIVNGWLQHYAYYMGFKKQIKEWLALSDRGSQRPGANDFVVNLRLGGDYHRLGWCLDSKFFLALVKQQKFDTLHIVTDVPDSPVLDMFRDYSPNVVHSSPLEDLSFLKAAKCLAISQSSFSWWGAFLSDARKIYFPITERSLWSFRSPVRLQVIDESRYEYLPAVTIDGCDTITF